MKPNKEIRIVSLCNLPLCEFKIGQPLMIKFSIGNDHYAYWPVEFMAIEKGLVKVKCLPTGGTPDWYGDVEEKYPNLIATVRAKSCYLWGKGAGDYWERCHWFKNTKSPVEIFNKKE